jgi:plastocyanin
MLEQASQRTRSILDMSSICIEHQTGPTRASIPSALLALTVLLIAVAPARTATAPAIVTLDLTRYSKVAHIDAGAYAGVAPGRIVVHVGQAVVFVNSDSRHHTATSLGDVSEFPRDPHWTEGALHASGTIGAGAWSTGDIAPGARSSAIAATKAGTYLYGCFYDYTAGMRGEIVVEP